MCPSSPKIRYSWIPNTVLPIFCIEIGRNDKVSHIQFGPPLWNLTGNYSFHFKVPHLWNPTSLFFPLLIVNQKMWGNIKQRSGLQSSIYVADIWVSRLLRESVCLLVTEGACSFRTLLDTSAVLKSQVLFFCCFCWRIKSLFLQVARR